MLRKPSGADPRTLRMVIRPKREQKKYPALRSYMQCRVFLKKEKEKNMISQTAKMAVFAR